MLGNEKKEETDFRRGRIKFFPTFFYKIGSEIINPHDREKSKGTRPIQLECVPKGENGVFSLLYVPVFVDKPETPPPDWQEVLEDLRIVCETANSMLCEKGFGAKTSSGYGRAEITKW